MTPEQIAEKADALYHDLDLGRVKQFRDEHPGAKVIGYLPIYAPREVVDAAGMLPVGITGGRGQIEIIRGDAYFQSYICQIPRSTIELALSGRFQLIDGFLFPSTCDVIRNLSGMWRVLFPEKYVRYVDVPQNFDPKVGGKFFRGELGHLRDDLAKLGGRPVTDDDLRRSIVKYNENRSAVSDLFALRNAAPWRALALESYLVLFAGNVLPVEEHTTLIRDYIAAVNASDRPMRDNARVVTIGSFCEQPPLGLIKTLEMAGCYIVWDDMTLSKRWLTQEISTEGDPLTAIAEAFLTHSHSNAVLYEPRREKGDALMDIVRRTKAEGVVFAAPSFCDPALLEQPMLTEALDREQIPWTAFKYSENLGQFQVIREQAGTFADSIKLWSPA
ncbi:MAG: benzoyl-CoA reductase subunit C [Polyangiaceae bacterium]|nr:benzoyl-CoA reductase subunit C [Polyangiaceae bacterium]